MLEYSKNYSKASERLWNYYGDEPNSGALGNINHSIKIFYYNTSNTENWEITTEQKNADVVVPLKYLRNFWRTLDVSLINYEVILTLDLSEKCVLTSKETRNAAGMIVINNPIGVTFKITDTKLYVLVVTLSTENDNKI